MGEGVKVRRTEETLSDREGENPFFSFWLDASSL